MILSVSDINKSYADVPVLEQVSFHLEDQEKAAVVGINGAGKSTLLKIIAGESDPDEGSVTLAKDKTIGYLSQHQEAFGGRTVYEEVLEGKRDLVEMELTIHAMEAEMQMLSPEDTEAFLEKYHRLLDEFKVRDGYSYASEVNGILKGLGFTEEEFEAPCDTLSGGQKTRVALARLLVSHPALILLDEPTNHLDIASIGWLETFLSNYKGAVLVVAHDRYFLDRIVTKVVEIRDHRATVYKGNYSYYASRAGMKISLAPSIESGKDVLHVEGLKKSYGDNLLFRDLSFHISRGEHVALIGENGTGKTTILKILNQVIDADDGLFRLGTNVVIGYYDQEQQDLHPELTLFEEIAEERPDLTNTQIRNILAAFLFRGDEVFLSVGDLSGGERGRLSLAKLMLSEANLLILDEPTNHLDMESREILESALNQYEGTVLFVSHDRYFINKTASRILELENGQLTEYLGNYDYYLEKKAEQGNAPGVSEHGGGKSTVGKTAKYGGRDDITGEGADSSGRADWVAQKEEQARIRKLQNRIERTEQEITALEEHLDQIDEAFQKPEVATNPSLLSELHGERSEITRQLEELYTEWETLADASKSP